MNTKKLAVKLLGAVFVTFVIFAAALMAYPLKTSAEAVEMSFFNGNVGNLTVYDKDMRPGGDDSDKPSGAKSDNAWQIRVANATVTGGGCSLDHNTELKEYRLRENNGFKRFDLTQLSAPAVEIWFYLEIEDWNEYWAQSGDYNVQFSLLSSTMTNAKFYDLDGAGYRIDLKGQKDSLKENKAWHRLVLPVKSDLTDSEKCGFAIHDIACDKDKIDTFAMRKYGEGNPIVYVSSVKFLDLGEYVTGSDGNIGVLETVKAFDAEVVAEGRGTATGTKTAVGKVGSLQFSPDPGYEIKALYKVSGNEQQPIALSEVKRKDGYSGFWYDFTAEENTSYAVTFGEVDSPETSRIAFPTDYTFWETPSKTIVGPNGGNERVNAVFSHGTGHYEQHYACNSAKDPEQGIDVSKMTGATLTFWLYTDFTSLSGDFYFTLSSHYTRVDEVAEELTRIRQGYSATGGGWDYGKDSVPSLRSFAKTGWHKVYLPLNADYEKSNVDSENITTFSVFYQPNIGGVANASDRKGFALYDLKIEPTDKTAVEIVHKDDVVAMQPQYNAVAEGGRVEVSVSESADGVSQIKFLPDLGYEFSSATISSGSSKITVSAQDLTGGAYRYENTPETFEVSAVFTKKAGASDSAAIVFTDKHWSEGETPEYLYRPNALVKESQMVFRHGSGLIKNFWQIADVDVTKNTVNALEIWFYMDKPEVLTEKPVFRLISGFDATAADGDLDRAATSNSLSWDVLKTDIVAGWNRMTLPFDRANLTNGFTFADARLLLIDFAPYRNDLSEKTFMAIAEARYVQTDAAEIENETFEACEYPTSANGVTLTFTGSRYPVYGQSVSFKVQAPTGHKLSSVKYGFDLLTPDENGNYSVVLQKDKQFTVESVEVRLTAVSIDQGETLNLTYGENDVTLVCTVSDSGISGVKTEWHSDNENVVAVDKNGKLKLRDNGVAVITVTVKLNDVSVTDSITVNVSGFLYLNDVTIDQSDFAWEKGDADVVLSAMVSDAGLNGVTISWSSSDEKVVKVDAEGKLTMIGNGEAIIVVRAERMGMVKTDAITVTVSGIEENAENAENSETAKKGCSATIGTGTAMAATIMLAFGATLFFNKKERQIKK